MKRIGQPLVPAFSVSMQHIVQWLAPLLALASSGCMQRLPSVESEVQSAAAMSFTERMALEAERLKTLFDLDSLVQLAILIALAMLTARTIAVAVRFAWRLGFDADRRLGGWEGGSRVVIAALVIYIVGRRIAVAAPIFAASALVLFASVSAVVLSSQVQGVLVGATLLLRRRVRTGDRIRVSGHEGVIQRVGWTEIELLCDDGATVHVPNRLVGDTSLTVAREKHSAPVRVRLALANPVSRELLESARRAALMSPYRAPKSAVLVQRDAADARVLEVTLQVFAPEAASTANNHLEASIQALAESDARPAPPSEAA